MLGNDVVDLRDHESRPETFRDRFDARVYTPGERALIEASNAPLRTRWLLWAAKEAAFKAVRQRHPALVFAPRQLVVRLEPASTAVSTSDVAKPGERRAARRGGQVLVPGQGDPGGSAGPVDALSLELDCVENDEFVHVIAAPRAAAFERLDARVAEVDAESVEAPSIAVRRLAKSVLSVRLGVDAARLTIGRREARIPVLGLDGERLAVDLSLSHHGRFVAFAAAPASESAAAWLGARPGPGPEHGVDAR